MIIKYLDVIFLVELPFELDKKNISENINAENISHILKSYLRVLKLTKKPSKEEFLTIAKVAGLGILAVGTMGFIIYVLLVLLPKWLVTYKP
jgi:protein transport protein SEC61 subunit gamma-like protein